MPDLWFVLGLAFGMVLMGFVTIGSYDRGAESVRLRAWKQELVARKQASITSRSRQAFAPAFVPDITGVPIAAAVAAPASARPAPAAERRTRIRRDPAEVLTHISL